MVSKVNARFLKIPENRGLTFETSDSDFCDLLNELFHMIKIFFLKKNQSSCLILKSLVTINKLFIYFENLMSTNPVLFEVKK